jgi:hypothetical protein
MSHKTHLVSIKLKCAFYMLSKCPVWYGIYRYPGTGVPLATV